VCVAIIVVISHSCSSNRKPCWTRLLLGCLCRPWLLNGLLRLWLLLLMLLELLCWGCRSISISCSVLHCLWRRPLAACSTCTCRQGARLASVSEGRWLTHKFCPELVAGMTSTLPTHPTLTVLEAETGGGGSSSSSSSERRRQR
jgi:hypothetical protein